MAIEQYDEAEVEAQRAIALDPNYARAYQTFAGLLNVEVKPTEALVTLEKAIRLDPQEC